MSNAKKLLYTMAAGVTAGAILGILYAPSDGAETRRRLNKLKQKFSCCNGGCCANDDKDTLEELSRNLQKELDLVNKKLESL